MLKLARRNTIASSADLYQLIKVLTKVSDLENSLENNKKKTKNKKKIEQFEGTNFEIV